MDAGIERVGRLLVLLVDIALAHNAAETDLHMLAGAAEPIVQFEMTERGVEVVLPHQADRTLAEPDAFAPGSGAGHDAARFGDFVGTTGGLLRSLPLAGFSRLLLPVLGEEGAVLGEEGDGYKSCRADDNCKETPSCKEHGSHNRIFCRGSL